MYFKSNYENKKKFQYKDKYRKLELENSIDK